ncbi:MAG: RNA polymerase sigma factor [Cyclobacteriaceae bacterium]|nr:RNA polymerase sigma factor [Cyclobacteriaceae bacterium]
MNNNQIDDSKLVSLYLKGNEESFGVLLNRYKSKVFTTIFLIVKDKYVAEDLTQDTFVKAINTLRGKRYNEEGKFKPWILRIAHNLAIDHFRKNKRYPTIVMEDGSNVFNTLEFAERPFETFQLQQDTKRKLQAFIEELPDNQREVIMMRHYMEMSFQDIADATNVSINTALGRMRYALINLRKKMKQHNIAYDQNIYPS